MTDKRKPIKSAPVRKSAPVKKSAPVRKRVSVYPKRSVETEQQPELLLDDTKPNADTRQHEPLPVQLSLPPVGATTKPADMSRSVSTPQPALTARQVADMGTTLSLPETVARLGWSMKTGYRHLRAGKLVGAHKVVGASGETWVIPVATVETLQAQQQTQQRKANPDAALVVDMTSKVHQLELELASVRATAVERGQIIEQLQNTMRALTVATEHLTQANSDRAETVQALQAQLAIASGRKWYQRALPTGT